MANSKATIPPGWNAYRQCLSQLVPGLASTADNLGSFPVLSSDMPLYAAWAPQESSGPANPWSQGGAQSQTSYDPKRAFNDIVNYIPQVNYVYRPTANTVTQAYGLILDALQFTTISEGKSSDELNSLYSQQSSVTTDINTIRSKMWQSYINSPQYPSTQFQSYMVSAPEFQQYQMKVQQLSTITLQIRRLIGPGGAVANAITEYNAMINPATAPSVLDAWRWGDEDVTNMILNWRAGKSLNSVTVAAKCKAGSESANTYIDSSSGGTGFLTDIVFSYGAGPNGSKKEDIHKSNSEVDLGLEVKAWAEVPVVINDVDNKKWYNGALLREYAQDRFFAGTAFTGATSGDMPVYGPNGIYPWRIASVIVAFQPKITIGMTRSDYDSLQSVVKSTHHWSVGPFGIFGGGSSTHIEKHSSVSFNNSQNQVSVQDENQNPVILGFVMESTPK